MKLQLKPTEKCGSNFNRELILTKGILPSVQIKYRVGTQRDLTT